MRSLVRTRRRWNLLIGLAILAILATLGGAGAHRLAAHRFRGELAEARKELEAGLLGLARKRLTRLAEERPGEAEVAYQLGRCEAARGRADRALTLWARIPADSPWAAPAALESAGAAIPHGSLRRGRAGPQGGPAPTQSRAARHPAPAADPPGPARPDRRGAPPDRNPLARDARVARGRLRRPAGHDPRSRRAGPGAIPLEWNLSQSRATGLPPPRTTGATWPWPGPTWPLAWGDFDRAESELQSCRRRWPDDPRSGGRGWSGPSPPTGSNPPARRLTMSRLACWTRPRSWNSGPGSPASGMTPRPSVAPWSNSSRWSPADRPPCRDWPSCSSRPASPRPRRRSVAARPS